jgi:hypothetical protein
MFPVTGKEDMNMRPRIAGLRGSEKGVPPLRTALFDSVLGAEHADHPPLREYITAPLIPIAAMMNVFSS